MASLSGNEELLAALNNLGVGSTQEDNGFPADIDDDEVLSALGLHVLNACVCIRLKEGDMGDWHMDIDDFDMNDLDSMDLTGNSFDGVTDFEEGSSSS
jgi:hypothetical protein